MSEVLQHLREQELGSATLSEGYILALDLGTTGNRAFLFDSSSKAVAQTYKELTQYYPQPGWLEHEDQEIWHSSCALAQSAIQTAQINANEIVAIGLTVQRETCLIWDKTTTRTAPQSNCMAGSPHCC
jgi:glycerol kinase